MRENGGWKGTRNGVSMPSTMAIESGGDVGVGNRGVCWKRERKKM